MDQYAPNYLTGQLAWLENDLATTTKPWKFIVLHEPGWSAGPPDYSGNHGNNTSVQDYIQPLCEQYSVAIVFCGHNHYYSRAVVSGVMHITTGGGGAPLTQPQHGWPDIVTATRAHHYCKVEINGGLLTFTAIKPDGTVIDSFTLTDSRWAESGAGFEEWFTSVEEFAPTPADHVLVQNCPNPFNPLTTIRFTLPQSAQVDLAIYDVSGRLVATLIDGWRDAGTHEVAWNAAGQASGIYLCRIEAGNFRAVTKMMLVK
ncbi:MAG: T9SS type A sorting domain-containing protein [bacterium]